MQASGILPRCGGTLERQIFEHTRPCACEPHIKLSFNLAQGRLGVLIAPFIHAGRDVFGQLMAYRWPKAACHRKLLLNKSMADMQAYHRFRCLTTACKNVHHTRLAPLRLAL
jgi:hypothetical protein